MSARDDHNSPMDLSLKIILVCLGFKRTFSFKMRRSAAPAPCRAVSWIVLDWRGWFRRLVAAGCWTRSSRAIDWRLRLEGSLKLLPNEMAESLFSRLFCRRFAGTKKGGGNRWSRREKLGKFLNFKTWLHVAAGLIYILLNFTWSETLV